MIWKDNPPWDSDFKGKTDNTFKSWDGRNMILFLIHKFYYLKQYLTERCFKCCPASTSLLWCTLCTQQNEDRRYQFILGRVKHLKMFISIYNKNCTSGINYNFGMMGLARMCFRMLGYVQIDIPLFPIQAFNFISDEPRRLSVFHFIER